MKGRRYQRSQN